MDSERAEFEKWMRDRSPEILCHDCSDISPNLFEAYAAGRLAQREQDAQLVQDRVRNINMTLGVQLARAIREAGETEEAK